MEGGSGRTSLQTPSTLYLKNGKIFVLIVWNSKNYDYMIVNEKKYLNENAGGNSTFTIEIPDFSKNLHVIADTVAMSTPHEIEYTLIFSNLR